MGDHTTCLQAQISRQRAFRSGRRPSLAAGVVIAIASVLMTVTPALANELRETRGELDAATSRLDTVDASRTATMTVLQGAESRLAELREQLQAARRVLDEATADYEAAEDASRRAQARVRTLTEELRRARAELAEWRRLLSVGARDTYKYGVAATDPVIATLVTVATSDGPADLTHTLHQLELVLGDRVEMIEETIRLLDRIARLKQAAEELESRRKKELIAAGEAMRAAQREHQERWEDMAAQRRERDRLVAEAERLEAEHAETSRSVEALQASYDELLASVPRGVVRLPGASFDRELACPAASEHQFINDWGFARSGGRTHQGTDIFQPYGSPVVAMADGVVARLSRTDTGLGGLTVTYTIDGYRVYNAHLSAVAPGLTVGQKVYQGEVIGAVGTSGNARGTPPHNHLGIYTPGGRAVNPYPLLAEICW